MYYIWASFGILNSKSLYSSTNALFFNGPSKLCQTSFIEMHTYFSFGLILQDIPNSITPQTTFGLLPTLVRLLVLPCTHQCRWSPPYSLPPFFFLSRTEEPMKSGTCAHDRHVLQQLARNVHIKHSDLPWPDMTCTTKFKGPYEVDKSTSWHLVHSTKINSFIQPMFTAVFCCDVGNRWRILQLKLSGCLPWLKLALATGNFKPATSRCTVHGNYNRVTYWKPR